MSVHPFRPRPRRAVAGPAPAPDRLSPACRLALACALLPFAAVGWTMLVTGLVLLDATATTRRWFEPGADDGIIGRAWHD